MQVALRCPDCGSFLVVHPGPLIDLPQGVALLELFLTAEQNHRCPNLPKGT